MAVCRPEPLVSRIDRLMEPGSRFSQAPASARPLPVHCPTGARPLVVSIGQLEFPYKPVAGASDLFNGQSSSIDCIQMPVRIEGTECSRVENVDWKFDLVLFEQKRHLTRYSSALLLLILLLTSVLLLQTKLRKERRKKREKEERKSERNPRNNNNKSSKVNGSGDSIDNETRLIRL